MSLYFALRSKPAAAAARLSLTLVLLHFAPMAGSAAAQQSIAGTVVDQSGRALPRARVRLLDGAGAELQAVFADEAGRFTFDRSERGECRIEVHLAGFAIANVPCAGSPDRPAVVQLSVAPIADTVVVTATRTDAPAGQVGASLTVFDAEDLERRQMPFVAELLRAVPGAVVVRNGAPGAVTSLFVRGGESDYNKILIDGIPVNEPGGAFYLNNLTTENLERVEIARGAYSSLFGSDAMASVIQLFTRRGNGTSRTPTASVQLDGGSYHTVHGSAAVSGGAGRYDYSLGAARFQSDNRDPNSAAENTTLSANVGIAIDPATTLRFVARGELEHAGTPGPTAFGRPDLDAFFERDDAVAGVTLDQQLTRSFRQRASYSLAWSDQTSTNLIEDPPFVAAFQGRTATFTSIDFLNDSHAALRRHHVEYQGDWRLAGGGAAGDQLLTFLADWHGERATLKNRLAGTGSRHRRDNFGIAAQQQMLWRRFSVAIGARLERNGNFGVAVVPRGSIVYVAHESAAAGRTRIRASAGTGIKEPTMLESFSASPFFRGNPDLDPERSRSVEVAVEHRFAGDRALVDLAWFDNRFRDIISLRSDPATFEGQYFNVGTTDASGLELTALIAPTDALRLRASYTFLDSQIVETTSPGNPLFAPGAWAFRRPRHAGSAGATLVWGVATLDVNGVFIGRFVDSDFGLFDPPLTESPGHSTWDGRLAVRLSQRLTGLLTVDNIGNADYSESFGYRPLRRVVRAGLRVRF